MTAWISTYLAGLGLGPEFEPYFTSILYDHTISEDDKFAAIFECLDVNCTAENINIQDAAEELFVQYAQSQGQETFVLYENGQLTRDTLDPFDDDEFNPFAPPSASDMEVLNGARNVSYGNYHSPTAEQLQYPPPIFYSVDENMGIGGGASSQQSTDLDQNMTPLEMLVMIIQDVSLDKIERAFAKSGYDFERTLEMLMSSKQSSEQDLAPTFMGDIRSTQTCRHFLQGNCFRRDCWYSHDLDSMVCKFWLKGQCLKGDTCEFNHFIDTSRMAEPSPPLVKQKPPTMDDSDFPSLSASISNKSKGTAKTSKSNGQHTLKNSKNGGLSEKGANTVDNLAVELEEKVKVSSPSITRPTISYSATAAAAASKPLTPLQRDDSEEQRRAFRLEMAPSSIPWLETGSALNNEYLKSRAQAIEYGKARNRCFELAAQAYLRNDGATAAKFSSQGREYNDLMSATHREASRQIFDSRNQGMIKSTSKGETWIDLHGLHVDESLACLDEFMEKLENEVYTGTVFVVTGTGNHSSNARAKLRPAIIEWLESWGYTWKEMSLDKVHGGVLAVQVIKGKA
ncbi:hypothetical protein EDD11_000886 [Mortierella claussenii]|nr:hypothetical protein EDD11_000886 [Mortierella claussenii]